jgi:hypothetical protein
MTEALLSDPRTLRQAWQQLHTAGTANPSIAHSLRTAGLRPFLAAFGDYLLGENGVGEGFRLVLGMNGEGKTHLLLCLRELALANGHAVALIDAKASSAGESALAFAREILVCVEPPEALEDADDEFKVARLVRVAVERRRRAAEAGGLDPDTIVRKWAAQLRRKDLHPVPLADALAEAAEAAFDGSDDQLVAAARKATLAEVKLSKREQESSGAQLLKSLPVLIQHLGFQPLVVLVDEAETVVEKKGSAKRREFMKFLRFLNDHVAHGGRGASAIVVIGCTDEFWPEQFNEYEALRQRLADPGFDTLVEREGLTPAQRVRKNKLWIRETFRGDEQDYLDLGAELVALGSRIYGDGLDKDVQTANAQRLARIASSDQVKRQVKRNFVKALTQTIEDQLAGASQRVLEEREAAARLDAAAREIQELDAE